MSKKFIDISIWETKEIQSLSKDAKLLFVYLYTRCDLAGFCRRNDDLFSFQTGIQDVNRVLKELNVLVCEDDSVLWLTSHLYDNCNYPLNSKNPAHKKIIHLFEITTHKQAREFFAELCNTILNNDNTLPYTTKDHRSTIEGPLRNQSLKSGELVHMFNNEVNK